MILTEHTDERERFGGDSRAINRHSVRHYYDENGNLHILDRNNSVCPPCFTLGVISANALGANTINFPSTIPIGGKQYFGDGLGWKTVEALIASELGAEIKRQ